jgi:signal transduction histidine kinase/CheY-like chemotaxis protein
MSFGRRTVGDNETPQMPRRFRLRLILALLVLTTTVPLAVFAGTLIWSSWRQQQILIDEQNIELARAIRVAIDQEVERTISALKVLARLNPPELPDRTRFVEIATRVLPDHPGWESIRLVDTSMQVLADSASPGAPRPVIDEDWIRTVLERRSPAVSALRQDPASGVWVVSIGVPVETAGVVRYVLVARVRAAAFSEILRLHQVPKPGVAALIDGNQHVIARTLNEASYIGRPPALDFAARARSGPEGAWRSVLLEGTPSYSAWSRSELTGWTLGIGLPSLVVDGPVRQSLYLLSAAGLAVLAAGMLIALLVTGRIVRAQRSAAEAARALARDVPMQAVDSRITEVAELFGGLREAQAILHRRMAERDAAQAEADRQRAAVLAQEQEARRAAESISRSKDEFIATVSHELRTPLNAILGWVSLLGTGSLDEARTRHALAIIDRNARAQARLVEDLLDMARVVRGSVRLDHRPVDLSAALFAVVESLQPMAQSRQVRLSIVESAPATVSGDPARLQQVLWNLLANGLKFTPSGGWVEARLRVEETLAVLRVTDNGEGISPDFLPMVFDRFRQESSAVTREHEGLGIGLSLVRFLTELHGGTVEAESDGKGLGATFTLRLPILDHASRPLPALASVPPLPAPGARVLEGLRILVVDDAADSRELVAAALREAGADVTEARSAAEALAAFEQAAVDMVVSDVAMPERDGFELVRALRATSHGFSLPIVAVTAFGSPEDRAAALDAGFDAHVGKPFEPRALVGLLSTFVKQ